MKKRENTSWLSALSPEERTRFAARGGRELVIQAGREHMAKIGKMGGLKTSQDRLHMAEIGRRGGKKNLT